MKRYVLCFVGVGSVFAATACSKSDTPDPLAGVPSIAILERAPRMSSVGDVFQYTSYVPGARLFTLSPPAADGKQTELCCSAWPEFANVDIQSYDIAFDARSIVFSARLTADDHYGLYILPLDETGKASGPPNALAVDPSKDYVYPVFAPKDRIVFVTNEVVEPGAPQHRDEYERGTTTQLGVIGIDGTGEFLGPRNLSHRTAPTMLSDGRVLYTQWDHLGDMNQGDLMLVNPDLTTLREAFGKEGTGVTNSYLKAIEMEPGRLVAIGTSRDRTIQSGKLLDIQLGSTGADGVYRQGEKYASARDLTPEVPGDNSPAPPTVGRYYSAYPVRAADGSVGANPFLLVSWSDGPVDEMDNVEPDFGIYGYDSATGLRRPIFNDPALWDVEPRPLMPRAVPVAIDDAGGNGLSDTSLLMGSLNVYDSSLFTITPGSVIGVRAIEGFSVEEGIPNDFGLTESEGAARLGEIPIFADGSWAALVPANIPIHLQPYDRFGMAIESETVWISGRQGESRFCGGCHEDRGKTTVIQPGVTMALAAGTPPSFDRPRAERRSTTYTQSEVVGVPWDLALQPIFDAKCAACHDGDPNKPGNKSLTFTDTLTGETQTFTFDLRGEAVTLLMGNGTEMISGYTASHLSLLGPMMGRLEENGITVTGDMPNYIEPSSAKTSLLFQTINPPQLYPIDTTQRFMPGSAVHPADVGGEELTPDEYYLLILMADQGGQFYSRENAPGGSGY